MNAAFTPHFQRSYHKLTSQVQRVFDRKLRFLLKNVRHPSLRVKKYDESRNIWQARITGSRRVYFEIKEDFYIFHEIRSHTD